MEESKQIAAHALARLGNISAAARLAGVDRTSIHRWLNTDADFAELVERLKQDIGAMLHARTLEHLGHAIDRAAQLVDSPNQRVALAAIRIFVDLASKSAGDWATRTTPDLALHRVQSIIALQAVEGMRSMTEPAVTQEDVLRSLHRSRPRRYLSTMPSLSSAHGPDGRAMSPSCSITRAIIAWGSRSRYRADA